MPITKSKTITLYTLEEMLADEKLKANLLKANRESEQFIQIAMEDRVAELELDLEQQGFEKVKIYYDLSCSQGSGCCFDYEGINIFQIIRSFPEQFKEDDTMYSKTQRNVFATHYCHSKTRDIRIADIQEGQFEASIKTRLEKVYQDCCSHINNILQIEYDYFNSDEFLIEDLKAREDCSLFYENGVICNEYDITSVEAPNPSLFAEELDKALSNEDDFVIINSDGKLFCYSDISDEPRDGDFLDTSSDEDLGFKKAILMTKEEAQEFIVNYLQDEYDIIPVEQAFKRKGENK